MANRSTIRNLFLLVLMLTAASLGMALKPSQKVGAARAHINLESIIPKQFGDWSIDMRISPILPAPDLEEKVSQIYDETLARTYVNSKGEFVMLSIAYGGDQTGRLRVHRPESCYSAQGFQVKKILENNISTGGRSIPVKRLVAQSGNRHEPITYWIRVGNSTMTSLLEQRLTQMRFGLTGEIPDGLIFRVSSINSNNTSAFRLHDTFIFDLLNAVPSEANAILIGTPSRAPS